MDEKRPKYRRVEIVAGAETRNELQDFLCKTGDVCGDPFVALGLGPLPPRVERLLLDAGCDSIWLYRATECRQPGYVGAEQLGVTH